MCYIGWEFKECLCIFKVEIEMNPMTTISTNTNNNDTTGNNTSNSTITNENPRYFIVPPPSTNGTNTPTNANTTPNSSQSLSHPILVHCTVINNRPLTARLLRAITSVKWSPTLRYLLLGYGVRETGRVQDHTEGYVYTLFVFTKTVLITMLL
jgi:hypothetical protein